MMERGKSFGVGLLETIALVIVVFACWWSLTTAGSDSRILRCSQISRIPQPRFHLLQPCSFSRMVLVALTRTTSLDRCAAFAHRKQGLAINYNQASSESSMASNCLVLDCPEYDNLLSLEANSAFDYYSLYTKPIPQENTTCIPGVGMFYLHKTRVNYSEAVELCENRGGKLANVVSESRTNGLSNLVATLLGSRNKLSAAYVGLTDKKTEGEFISFKNRPLQCFPYRAWAPNEPRNKKAKEDCVVLDSRKSWRVVDCASRQPFICELTPSGPPEEDIQLCYRIADLRTKAMCLARANYSEFLSSTEYPDRCERLEEIGMINLNKTISIEASINATTSAPETQKTTQAD